MTDRTVSRRLPLIFKTEKRRIGGRHGSQKIGPIHSQFGSIERQNPFMQADAVVRNRTPRCQGHARPATDRSHGLKTVLHIDGLPKRGGIQPHIPPMRRILKSARKRGFAQPSSAEGLVDQQHSNPAQIGA